MAYTIETYTLNGQAGTFQKVDEIISFAALSFSKVLNAVSACSFTMNDRDLKATKSNFQRYRTQILIKENDIPVWLGFISRIRGSSNIDEGSVTFECISYFGHLFTRFTGASFLRADTPVNTVVSDYVTLAQTGTYGDLALSVNSTGTFSSIDETTEYANIGQAIINLSDNIGGFDWIEDIVVDADNQLSGATLNLYEGAGQVNVLPAIEIQNLASLNYYSTEGMANEIVGLGFGTGDSVITASSTNTSAQEGYGLRQSVEKYYDLRSAISLQSATDKLLNETAVETYSLGLTLNPNKIDTEVFTYRSLALGDIINLNIIGNQNGFINFTNQARIIGVEAEVDDVGATFLSLNLSYIN